MCIFKLKFTYIIITISTLVALNCKNASFGKDLSPQEIASNTSKSVVLIVTHDYKGQELSLGSGFLIEDGYVATCLHVFKRAAEGNVKLLNADSNYKIDKIVAFDLNRDLCVFTIIILLSPQLLHLP